MCLLVEEYFAPLFLFTQLDSTIDLVRVAAESPVVVSIRSSQVSSPEYDGLKDLRFACEGSLQCVMGFS
mgnify:CR=1 FL=1